jgi:hypothetical protein
VFIPESAQEEAGAGFFLKPEEASGFFWLLLASS